MVLDLSNCTHFITCQLVEQKLEELNAKKDDVEEVVFGRNFAVDDFAFKNFKNLKSLKDIRYACSLGQESFADCVSLEEADLRYNVEIPKKAFARCTSLHKVVFAPFAIVNEESFADCNNLTTAANGQKIAAYWKNSFNGCSKLNSSHIGNESTKCYETFDMCINEQFKSLQDDNAKQVHQILLSKYNESIEEAKKSAITTVYRGKDKCYYYMLLEWINNIRQFYDSQLLDIHVVLGKDDYLEVIQEHAVRDLVECKLDNVFFHINKDTKYVANNNVFNVFFVDWSRYSRVLYCDIDVVINKPFSALLTCQFDDQKQLLCVSNDPPFKKESTFQHYMQLVPKCYQSKFKMLKDSPMFNGGMFVFRTADLQNIQKQIKQSNDLIYELQCERNQHLLNYVFYGKTQFVDAKYNNLYNVNKFNISQEEAVINHYTTCGTEILYSKILNKLYSKLQAQRTEKKQAASCAKLQTVRFKVNENTLHQENAEKKEILLVWFGDNEPAYAQWNVENFKRMNPGWEVTAKSIASFELCRPYVQNADHACVCCSIDAFPIAPFDSFMSLTHFCQGKVYENSESLISNVQHTAHYMLQVQKDADLHSCFERDQSGIYFTKGSRDKLAIRAAEFKKCEIKLGSSFCNNELSPIENLGEVK